MKPVAIKIATRVRPKRMAGLLISYLPVAYNHCKNSQTR